MPTLSLCIKKHGSGLDAAEIEALKERVDTLVSEGYSRESVDVAAVEEMLDSLEAEMESINKQVEKVRGKEKKPIQNEKDLDANVAFFQKELSSGVSYKNIISARSALAKSFDSETVKPGDIDTKVVDEAIEVAAVRVARDIVKTGKEKGLTSEEIFDSLVDLQNRMPNLSVRTSTSIQNQAYSTPLPLAFLASELAGIDQNTKVYEPSAGNGALLIGANSKNVVANELNPDRAKNLDAKIVVVEDGTMFKPGFEKDVVIANPPFGSVKDDSGKSKEWKINDQYTTTSIDHAMIFKALESMKDDGKAVFIIGSVSDRNTSLDVRKILYRTKNKVELYKTLFDNYNVIDHFSVAGSLYSKQGAAWPVDVIVIDGKGKSERALPGAVPPDYLSTIEELRGKLNESSSDTMGPRGDRQPESDRGDLGKKRGDTDKTTTPPKTGDENTTYDRPGRGSGGSGRNADNGNGIQGDVEREPTGTGDDILRGRQPDNRERDVSGRSGADSSGRTGKTSSGQKSSADTERGRDSGPGKVDRESDNSVDDVINELLEFSDKEAEKAKIKSQIKEGQAKIAAATKEFNDLFGEEGSISDEKIDPDKWNKVRQILRNMFDGFKMVAKSIKEAAKLFIADAYSNLSEKGKVYINKFVKEDIRAEIEAEQNKENNNTKKDKTPAKKPVETSGQVAYSPKSKSTPIGTLVPTNMANSIKKALDKTEKKHGSIDEYVANKLGYTLEEVVGTTGEYGYFSAEQVDAIALAINNIDNGAGFIIGDQTGVGKGRVVAAMLRYAKKIGLTPIFVTEKTGLYTDIYRDFTDIGMADIADKILMTNSGQKISLTEDGSKTLQTKGAAIHNQMLSNIAREGHLPDEYDVIFTTYDQMNRTGSPRRDFLSAMAGNSGFLVMDESHNAGGSEGARATPTKTPRSVFFRQLVERSRSVFYSSATYAKRPGVMDLYSSTDMRFAVVDIKDLGDAITAGGVPLQQAVANMLAEAGQYIRRERSFDGVTYDTQKISIDRVVSEKIAGSLADIKKFSDDFAEPAVDVIKDGLASSGSNAAGSSAASNTQISSIGFSSIMHNLIDQMLLSLKTKGAIDEAIRAFKEEGKKPVITLSNTMGSFIEKYSKDNNLLPGDGIGLKFNDLIFHYLDKTRRFKETPPFTAAANAIERYISDDELGPIAVAEYNRISDIIHNLDLGDIPVSPVDYAIAKLTEAGLNVGEITGRTDIIEYKKDGTARYQRRPASERSVEGRTKTIYDFNTDKLDCLILNRSGATGLSLHALAKFEGHVPAQRHMIILQAEKNIDTHMQMLGRIHRAGQLVDPSYIQLVGDTPAEKRPAAVLAAKLASLNANTTASKDSDFSAKNIVDFMNKYGDRVVALIMADYPEIHTLLGAPLTRSGSSASGYKEEGAAKKVTGRIPLIRSIEGQENLYKQIESDYKDLIEQIDAMGENDLEAKTFDIDAKTIKKATVFQSEGDSPFTAAAYAEQVDMKKIGRSYTSDEVLTMLKSDVFGLETKEAKADERNLTETIDAGKERQRNTYKDTMEEFDTYKREVLDDIEKIEKRDAAEAKFDAIESDWKYIIRKVYPGARIELNLSGEYFIGTVLKVEKKGSPKNPLALGTWKVTFAIPDSMRRLTLSFSSLNKTETSWNMASSGLDERNLQDFDKATHNAREDRLIITGNMLAAFGRYKKGRIINFTTNLGTNKSIVRQGILMPKDFDIESEESERSVTLTNSKDIMKILDENIFVKIKGGDLTITPQASSDEVIISVPAARNRGGIYYLDRGILSAAGKDFIKSGNRMRLRIEKKKVKRILDIIIKDKGQLFENGGYNNRVKTLLGIETVRLEDVKDTKSVNTPLYQTVETFYSALEKGVQNFKQKKAPAKQWAAMINKLPVKAEELEWLGVEDWLNEQTGKVTKEQILDFIKANKVEVQEKTLSSNNQYRIIKDPEFKNEWAIFEPDKDVLIADGFLTEQDAHDYLLDNMGIDETEFSSYTLPGGENYKEMLLTLPVGDRLTIKETRTGYWFITRPDGHTVGKGYETEAEAEENLQYYIDKGTGAKTFTSSHFDEPNILAHIRMNERIDADGNKVLFIEEIQSDWAQEGRKNGFAGKISKEEIAQRLYGETYKKLPSDKQASVDNEFVTGSLGVPDMPFKQSKTWSLLAIKRMVRYAAENGFDSITWTTGETQADRYDLSKHIKRIDYRKETDGRYWVKAIKMGGDTVFEKKVNGSELENVVGKEIADKIINDKGKSQDRFGGNFSRLDNIDLKIGGEGMKGFYDKILPATVNKFFKKYGGKVEKGTIGEQPSNEEITEYLQEEYGTVDIQGDTIYLHDDVDATDSDTGWTQINKKDVPIARPQEVWTLPITPVMKQAALEQGFPLFNQDKAGDLGYQNISLKDVQAAFKGLDSGVTDRKTGKFWVKLKNGETIIINSVKEIDVDRIAWEVANQRAWTIDDKVRGQFRDMGDVYEIDIVRGRGDRWTIAHESVHLAEAAGMISQSDIKFLNRVLKNKGIIAPSLENRADFLTEMLTRRDTIKGYALGTRKAFQAIADMVDSFVNLFKRTVRGIARDIESGKVWNKSGIKTETESMPLYQTDRPNILEQIEQVTGVTRGKKKTEVKKTDVKQSAPVVEKPKVKTEPPKQPVMAKTTKTIDRSGDVMPDESFVDNIRRKVQDQYLPIRRVQEWLGVDSDELPYLTEELHTGKAKAQLDKLESDLIVPLMEAVKESNVSVSELEDYLYALHAPERNKHIQSINEAFEDDGGSGMTDDEAAEIIQKFNEDGKIEELKSLGKMVKKISVKQRAIIREAGLETPEMVDAWERYNNYIPLKGMDGDTAMSQFIGTAKGLGVKKSGTKRALGRESRATNLLANLFTQTAKTIQQAEVAKIGQSFLAMVEGHPNEDMWHVYKPGDKLPKKQAFVGGKVKLVSDPGFASKPTILTVTRDGEVYYIDVKHEALAASLKRLDKPEMTRFIRNLSRVNRYLSTINTMLNPEFVITNFERDLQTAMIRLSGEKGAKMAKDVAFTIPNAMKGIRNSLRGPNNSEMAGWYERFQQAGAQIGFMDLQSVDRKVTEIKRLANEDSGAIGQARRYTRILGSFIGDYNTIVENAVRLSAFKVAIENGVSEAKAASLAKNLTVNFNRKGEYGPLMNSAYLFYNAGVQGSFMVLKSMKHKKVRRVLYGITLASIALAELARYTGPDDDDGKDEWDKVNPYLKQTNFIFMREDGSIVKIKQPYGYNVFAALGVAISDTAHYLASDGKKGMSPENAAIFLAVAALDAFNPIGGSDSLLKMASPTIVDPFLDVAVNENFMKIPIRPENSIYGAEKPQSELYWSNVRPTSKAIAKTLNSLTGGDTVESGKIDWSPEVLDYFFDYVTGGAGRFYADSASTIKTIATEGKLPEKTNRIPFVRKVLGDRNDYYDLSLFRKNVDTTLAHYENFMTLKKDAGERYLKRHPELNIMNGNIIQGKAFVRMAKNQMSDMRDILKEVEKTGDYDKIEKQKEQMRQAAINFNNYLEKVRRNEFDKENK